MQNIHTAKPSFLPTIPSTTHLYLLTCEAGLEEIAIQEIKKQTRSEKVYRFCNMQSRILAETNDVEALFGLHSIHNIIEIVDFFHIPSKKIEDFYEAVKEISFPIMEKAQTFRITCMRYGIHDFSSVDMQKYAGKAVIEKYQKTVNLTQFDVNIRIDLIGTVGFAGIQLTEDEIYKKIQLPFRHRAAIKESVAYMMLQLADIQEGETIYDCSCGGGTIPIQVAHFWGDKVKILASEIHQETLSNAIENARANGFEHLIDFKCCDLREMNTHFPQQVDKIICNLPYGMLSGKNVDIKNLYDRFLVAAEKKIISGGRIVVITGRPGVMKETFMRLRLFKLVDERIVESGGIFPHIFVLEKIDV